MDDNEQNERSFSQVMWEDFSIHMDSSVLGAMQRIAAEAGMNDEMEVESEEITHISTNEANYGSELVIAKEANYGNEVVIDEVSSRNEEGSACRQEIESFEEKDPLVKMKHFLSCDKYFYVLDLIRAVKEEMINKENTENSPKRRKKSHQFSSGSYFAKRFGHYDFLDIHCGEKEMISLIQESIPKDGVCVFEICKERFIEAYKPKSYSKRGFVNFSAVIAYLGIYCSTTGLDPTGEIKATNYICCLLYEVLQRGTLERSSWGRSYFECK